MCFILGDFEPFREIIVTLKQYQITKHVSEMELAPAPMY